MKDKFLFLGASGGIGRLLRSAAKRAAPEDFQMHWQFRGAQPVPENILVWPDFADPNPLSEYVAAQGPFRAAFVFTGGGSGADKNDHIAMQAHVDVTRRAIVAAHRADIGRIFVASSSAVYGSGKGAAFHESDIAHPQGAYGAAKLQMEEMCQDFAAQSGATICALRIGNVAGADMLLMSAAARRDDPLQLDIFADGCGPRRSYIGPLRLFQVLGAMGRAEVELPAALNLAGAEPVDMKDLLDAAHVPWVGRDCRVAGHQNITLDTSALARILPESDLSQDPAALVAEVRACGGLP